MMMRTGSSSQDGFRWVGPGGVDGLETDPPKGVKLPWNFLVETFWWIFFWVGVQMSFWDGGEVVGV